MFNKKIIFLFMILIIGYDVSALGADEVNEADVKLEIGYKGVKSNGSLNKTAEYESDQSSVGGSVEMSLRNKGIGLDVKGRYNDEEDYEGQANVDLKRMLRGKYSYQRFIHRLRHDSLFKDEPHALASATNAFPQSIEHWIDTNGDGTNDSPADPLYDFYNGVIAANPVPMLTESGTIGLEGLQAAIFNDLDQGRDYMIERLRHKADVKFQLPLFPYLIPEIKYSYEEKHGWKQATLMTGQCTPCHTVGVGQKIDQSTEDISIGATFKKSGLTASYFHTEREFDNHTNDYSHQGLEDNIYWYDNIVKGASTATFMSREMFENERRPIGITSDIEKRMDTVKVRYDSVINTTFYGSYVNAQTKDDYSDLKYDGDTKFFSITNRSIDNLRLKAHVKQYNIDSDDLYVNLSNFSNGSTVTFEANGLGTVPVTYFNYNRPSSLSREVFETGLDSSYYFSSGYTLTGAYTYKVIDRDNDTFKEYDISELLDEYFLEDEKTTYNNVELGLSAHPVASLNLRTKYQYQHTDSPFGYYNGLGFDDFYDSGWTLLQDGVLIENPDTMDTNTAFYQVLRSVYRTASGSNVAKNHHNIKVNGTWTPIDNISVNLNAQYSYKDNNDADNNWKRDAWNIDGSIFWMPLEKLNFNLGYSYQTSTTRSRYSTPVFVGCFSESMGEQIASVYDDVDYDSSAQVLYLTSTYRPIKKLTLTADITATYAKARIDIPDFGDNIYYQNYVDVTVNGETQTVPYTETIMMSYLDYSNSDDYSELDYKTVDISLGAQYSINDSLALGLNGMYRWSRDNESYLGDDYDGELFIINSSISYRF